jgi:hypothetical protein
MRPSWSSLRLASPLLLLTIVLLGPSVSADDKRVSELITIDSRKLVTLDTDFRQAFTRTAGDKLPETKRKPLPSADVAAFDWVRQLGLTPIYDQGNKPNCIVHATIAALEWNWQIRNGGKTKLFLSQQPILDRLQKREFTHCEPVAALLVYGTATVQDYPYTGEPRPLRTDVVTPYRIVGWRFVTAFLGTGGREDQAGDSRPRSGGGRNLRDPRVQGIPGRCISGTLPRHPQGQADQSWRRHRGLG